ncbi:alpha/beta fold hydrolase [Tepidiforma sp.]|jgi:3-oxoadipate enol-lactonase|uniref:alpha/beta fold hydrolase n=1 Tax=Tepidiforma sp. TaxID=2682230 RepID=UPI00261E472F|nr:alpha/beta fold hydrolase [Tepidiforma sp.]MCX7618681.1 alpha/beta hydrolase [Tepidiforma sp.]
MPFAVCNGVRLYYEVHGSGEPLLLVMGQGSDHHGWDPVLGDFASRFQVIVYDHRGTGQSDKPGEPPYTTRMFAADAVGLLDHLGIERAHIYGISMGGRICQWIAIDYPDRVGAVVLGCTTPGDAHGVKRPPEVDAKMRTRPADPEEAARFLAEEMVSPGWLAAHPEYLAVLRERARNPIPAYAQRLHYEASQGHDAWERLTEIRAPVLVIHGTEDRINPTANAALLAGQIPGAELYLVEGGRHGYFIEFREEAGAAVMGFLERHTTR